jgi:hypothetical protein
MQPDTTTMKSMIFQPERRYEPCKREGICGLRVKLAAATHFVQYETECNDLQYTLEAENTHKIRLDILLQFAG